MTRHYAVIGDPVSHSLSPLLHNGWIADHGIDATYEAYQLRSEDPVAAIRALTRFDGMNVTVPHKQAAAQAAERSQGEVANVLRREADGSLSAFNTDGPGFLRSLDEGAPGWRESVRRDAPAEVGCRLAFDGRRSRQVDAETGNNAVARSLKQYAAELGVAQHQVVRPFQKVRPIRSGDLSRFDQRQAGSEGQ